ncbi:hypothetical protein A7D27_03225 [Pseudomonas sp. 1D4]|uniref:hypothetical protein n=1 Tax=Pseudomonadaceae TaxID=135621 RepID=UPI00084A38BC|nr:MULTISPECIES: hypothetical protein [Pseudomonas]OEC46378.1 hypothetical protein A7D27_03225 [Pseudomonas sp. 1D4]OEC60015.1 hypothetical protein A9G05_08560 [Pseudomonas sp. ENNP23]
MKAHALAALFLSVLSSAAFALPAEHPPVLGEARDGAAERPVLEPLAGNPVQQAPDQRLAEGGSDRLLRAHGVA